MDPGLAFFDMLPRVQKVQLFIFSVSARNLFARGRDRRYAKGRLAISFSRRFTGDDSHGKRQPITSRILAAFNGRLDRRWSAGLVRARGGRRGGRKERREETA